MIYSSTDIVKGRSVLIYQRPSVQEKKGDKIRIIKTRNEGTTLDYLVEVISIEDSPFEIIKRINIDANGEFVEYEKELIL